MDEYREIHIAYLQALMYSADQTGCTADLIVVSSVDLANLLHAAGIEQLPFTIPKDSEPEE
jgi:hypothetical protein